jgi:hypothetical protein
VVRYRAPGKWAAKGELVMLQCANKRGINATGTESCFGAARHTDRRALRTAHAWRNAGKILGRVKSC